MGIAMLAMPPLPLYNGHGVLEVDERGEKVGDGGSERQMSPVMD